MKAHHSFLDDGAYQNETSDRCRAAEALESYKLLPPSALNDSQTSSWTSGAFYLFKLHIPHTATSSKVGSDVFN
jgi:hypothetical protein